MANAYYVVTAAEVDEARACAPTEGAAHELFQIRYSADGSRAIVQAAWAEIPPGTLLGYYANGQADQAVYEELAKEEWQSD